MLRKARKSHRCHECDCEIRRGTYYIEDHICYVRRRREGSGFLWRIVGGVLFLSATYILTISIVNPRCLNNYSKGYTEHNPIEKSRKVCP